MYYNTFIVILTTAALGRDAISHYLKRGKAVVMFSAIIMILLHAVVLTFLLRTNGKSLIVNLTRRELIIISWSTKCTADDRTGTGRVHYNAPLSSR